MINVKNLNVQFGNNVLFNDLSFTINENEIFCIEGKSGTGKTTLLKCLGLLQDYNDGDIEVSGVSYNSLNTRDKNKIIKNQLGYIFQDYKLWCNMCGYSPFNYGNFVESIIKQYKITTNYDSGLRDQIVESSEKPEDYCPFEQSLTSSYN